MSPPPHLAIINLILFFITFVTFLISRPTRPHKPRYWFLFLCVFSFLPLLSVLRSGTYESGDLSINVVKTIAFSDNLREGNLIPRWAGESNATYGYPNFIFAYPLPYYLASLFHYIGFSFLSSVKLVLIFSFLLSGIFMYKFLSKLVNPPSAFMGSIAYLFTPYHLINLHFRVDIGELLAMAIFPLALFNLTQALKNPRWSERFCQDLPWRY
jgi:hypothetical protein